MNNWQPGHSAGANRSRRPQHLFAARSGSETSSATWSRCCSGSAKSCRPRLRKNQVPVEVKTFCSPVARIDPNIMIRALELEGTARIANQPSNYTAR